MAYPVLYDVTYSYTGFQQSQGDNSFPGTQLDADLAGLQASIDDLATFVEGFSRSDGKLGNNSVDFDQLTTAVKASIGDTAAVEEILAARDDAQAAATTATAAASTASTAATSATASAASAASSASAINIAGSEGTGPFVRKTGPHLVTPDIGVATGASLQATGGLAIGGAAPVNDGINSGVAGIAFLVSGSTKATLVNGWVLGSPTGGDKGLGTLNATGLYQNGVAAIPGLYPEWYGAVGDGVANDTAAIAAWLLASNGKIALGGPGKTYLTDPVVVSQTNVNVPRLLDMQGAKFKARAASGNPLLTIENPHGLVPYNFEFKNATLDANALHAYPFKIHGMQQGIVRNILATNGTTGGAWLSGEPGYGIYYCLFENIASEANTGAAWVLKSINNSGGYYIASNTWSNCRAGGSSTFGYDIDYASGVFLGCEAEGNTSGGWNLDHTIDLVLLDTYTEINGSPDKSFVATTNAKQVKIIGGRIIGTITATLLTEVTNLISTGDASGNAVNYIGGVNISSTGIKLPASAGFGLGGSAALADSFNSANALTFLINGASEFTIDPDSSVTSLLSALRVTYHNGTALQRLGRVSIGAADSGGAGFRVLRVPN